ncbi:MAG: hypothetical protein AAB723_01190 [Patescibacteria group bacterium]
MTKIEVAEKILKMENQLEFLKRFFIQKPDFNIDERNWEKVRLTTKAIRGKIYKKTYGKK